MIGIVIYSLVFIFGLIFTLSTIPPTKKLLTLFLQSFHHPQNPPHLNYDQLTHTTTRQAHELRDVFATFDKNSDGYITRHELSESLRNIGISAGDKDVADMVEKVDSNGDGLIDFDEFCQIFDEKEEEEDGDLKEAFDVFDGNKDGLITVDELGLVLSSLGFSEGKKIEDCKEMIRKVDMDGDGMVNFDEFKKMMKSGFIGRPLIKI
ncbi:calmodulin-like protein 7 [Phtheirospermum japonicum]|uniref:Calmodulin-like protein 7 n=1 Tax=Phtheirospermum japonicum TaxID=374723 RepID=A0A830BRV7_9LAMI|nr:calmodulin-like protein 7 [Phtheirospermum japonicum]